MSVTIRATGVRVTDKVFLIDLDGERHWLPKSQIESIDGAGLIHAIDGWSDDRLHEFVVSDWIAQQRGFVMSEVDEKYVADENRHGVPGVDLFAVRAGDEIMGFGATFQKASMIAAALNMTIGKV